MSRYEEAKKMYAAYGVDAEAAIERLKEIPLSVHCWQGDDVLGFDGSDSLDGGIQTTGNYPGKATGFEQLKEDIVKAFSLMPGKKRLNLHASYAVLGADKGKVDRDAYTYQYFEPWVKFAKENGIAGIDFNPTFFAHPKMKDGLSLSSPDEPTRKFWVNHGKACLKIAAELGKAMGSPCFVNIWIPDGYKDIPADRLGPRLRLKKSLDEILADYDKKWVIPAVESKVFGIGVESYTVGSAEFALSYAAMNPGKCIPLMDNGHYHPTEVVSDKIPALLTFFPEIALHITRPVRWDSDHVVLFDDETKELCKEIVRCGGLDGRVYLALDYFDASVNRIAAWVTGFRNVQKALLNALLNALLTPDMTAEQNAGNFTDLLVRQEELKTMPFGEVWAEYCRRCGVPEDGAWLPLVRAYEKNVLEARA